MRTNMFVRFSLLFAVVLALCVSPLEATSAPVARLRVANYVIDAPSLSATVGTETITADPLPFGKASPHNDVAAGTIDVAFRDGEKVIATAKVVVEAQYDYTAALIGQIADGSVRVVIIPESGIVAAVRDAKVPASYAILLHGISNGPAVDFSLDGKILREGLKFGEYDVFSISKEPHDILVTFSGDSTAVLFQNEGETPPANDLLLLTVMAGRYPDTLDVTGAVSRLPDRSVIDFLRTATDSAGSGFTTLLEALEVTGLAETLQVEGAFTLFAPTDAAFAALPEETRALLFAYPDALRAVLLGHIVDEVFVLRDLADQKIVRSRQGTEIRIQADGEAFQINEQVALLFGGFPVVTNGNVIGIDRLLVPGAGN
jgi:uncharacterized surface protein with fasciclin (FAS1) repeats